MVQIKTIVLTVLILTNLSCGWRAIPQSKNEVEATLAEITNQYKRRADLVPNLVSAVKGYTKHESETLVKVVEARAKATSITIDPSRATPAQIKQFQDAQNGLSSALSRLLVSVEQYPDLKASAQFRDLQAQLEGTENRITIARNRYIESIKGFN
ncbi:MAG: LemA family protein, partial [Pseudomonadota bacterium]|nr:LemA family protein [Pseudomonadota bacterium]